MAQERLRTVILTALALEYEAVRSQLRDVEPRYHSGSHYEVGVFDPGNELVWEILIAEIGAGNAKAAAEAQRAIEHFKPQVALFIGVAGGLKDVVLGDVVIGDRVYGYHSGKAKASFQSRPNVGQSGYEVVQAARAASRDWNRDGAKQCKTLVGPIAAGEQVIASTKAAIFAFLRQYYSDAIAVEMEGRGFLEATHMNADVQALVLRGISDLVDGKATADQSGSQVQAAQNAAEFAMAVLARYASGRSQNPQ